MKVSAKHAKTPRTHKGFSKGKNGDMVSYLGPITIEEILADAPQFSKYDTTIREMTLRTEPTNENSPVIKQKFKPLDNPTRVLEVLQGLAVIKAGVIGNNVTTGPLMYAYWKGCLTGTALRKFEEFAAAIGTETAAHLIAVEQQLVKFFAPREVLAQQTRYMRHKMRKPYGHSTRQYVGAVNTLNSKFTSLPPAYNDTQAIKDTELLDVLASQAPQSHKDMLTDQGFDPLTENVDKFIELCERAETKEDISNRSQSHKQKPRFTEPDSSDSEHDYKKKSKRPTSRTSRSPYYCKEHGRNITHDTKDCKVILGASGQLKPTKEKQVYKDYQSKYKKKSRDLHILQLETENEKAKWKKAYKKLEKAKKANSSKEGETSTKNNESSSDKEDSSSASASLCNSSSESTTSGHE